MGKKKENEQRNEHYDHLSSQINSSKTTTPLYHTVKNALRISLFFNVEWSFQETENSQLGQVNLYSTKNLHGSLTIIINLLT